MREGKAVEDFMNPDRVVVGADNREIAGMVASLYEKLQPAMIITDLPTAEMIKYASNAFLATKISFINEIANICERVGADVTVVAKGMGLDPRINPNFLNAGCGFGGSCLPKDVKALIHTAKTAGVEPLLLSATINVNERAKTISLTKKNYNVDNIGKIGILTAGTSDIPVAEEAKEAAKLMGCEVLIDYDVGIAGIHRIAKPLKKMLNEDVCCIIVIAGMEGALPSVVASLVDVPVIGVPTSTGYGIKETPLLTMLHSCAPGLAVVNIDNGFGAACAAFRILNTK